MESTMCDYSVEGPSRDPIQGEELSLYSKGGASSSRFIGTKIGGGSGSGASTMTLDPDCAVCVKAGTCMILAGLSADVQKKFGVGPVAKATMTRLDDNHPSMHKDAVKFDNGQIARLVDLNVGATAKLVTQDLESKLGLDRPLDAGLADDSDQVRARQPDFVEGDD